MSPEQQRIAIAEACGWKKMNWNEATVYGSPTHGFRVWKSKHQDSIMSYKGRVGERIPDYLDDLNAMHEAESFIRNAQDQMRYASETLIAMGFDDLIEASDLNVDYCWHAMGATAAQRAKAFLKTLNLWKP